MKYASRCQEATPGSEHSARPPQPLHSHPGHSARGWEQQGPLRRRRGNDGILTLTPGWRIGYHRGGETDRLLPPAAACQAEPGAEGGAAGCAGQGMAGTPTSLLPPTPHAQRPFKKPPCTWLVISACDRKVHLNPKYFHVNLSLDLILKTQMIMEMNT